MFDMFVIAEFIKKYHVPGWEFFPNSPAYPHPMDAFYNPKNPNLPQPVLTTKRRIINLPNRPAPNAELDPAAQRGIIKTLNYS